VTVKNHYRIGTQNVASVDFLLHRKGLEPGEAQDVPDRILVPMVFLFHVRMHDPVLDACEPEKITAPR